MVELKNITKKYGDSTIFNQTSFSFPSRGLVCIVGPSGCGKSTLLNLIAGFDSEYEGDICIHGTSLSKMNEDDKSIYRKGNLGFIFQNYNLLSGYTVWENIQLASMVKGGEGDEQRAWELLNQVDLSDKMHQKIEHLSGGQKQRVAIARALINQPSILLADEPTGALDRKNSKEIMELLKELSKNHLVIVITHDKSCAQFADTIVRIEEGKLLSDSLIDSDNEGKLRVEKTNKLSLRKISIKNFKVHLRHYLVIALAISIGCVCFSLSLSSSNVMDQSIAEFEAKNVAYHNGFIRVEDNEEELLEILMNDERIEHVVPQYVLENLSLNIHDTTVEIEKKFPLAKAKEELSFGNMPRWEQGEIAVNASLAAKFSRDIESLIGQKIQLTYQGEDYSLTICGIFNASFDDFIVSGDIEQILYKGQMGNVYSISYDVIDFENIKEVSDDLEQMNIYSKNASVEVEAFLSTFTNIRRLFSMISILILLIGSMLSAIVLVKQQNTRYHEVGLLRALGYSKRDVHQIISFENVGLTITSIFMSGIAIVGIIVVCQLLNLNLVITPIQILLTLLLSAGIVMMISYLACYRLLKVEPAVALRK